MTRVEAKPELLQWAGQRDGLGAGVLEHRFPKLGEWEAITSTTSLVCAEPP